MEYLRRRISAEALPERVSRQPSWMDSSGVRRTSPFMALVLRSSGLPEAVALPLSEVEGIDCADEG